MCRCDGKSRRDTELSEFPLEGGNPPTNHIWIATSAMEHRLQILTTGAHYEKVSQVMVEHFPS
jgi:predicted nucleic acid-binding protein